MGKHYRRARMGPQNYKKTGSFKPCRQCGKEFESQSKFNVYCWKCNELIERRSKTQRIAGVW